MSGGLGPEWLEAIARRTEAATPGPWTARYLWLYLGSESEGYEHLFAREDDATFVAHARTDVPRLLAEVERLGARLERELDFGRRAEARFLAAAHELTKEIAGASGLSYPEAQLTARELIETNYRHRTRPKEER